MFIMYKGEKEVFDLIQNRIQIDTEIARKKLLVTRCFIQNEIPFDIVENI
jgi:hypothetical protein